MSNEYVLHDSWDGKNEEVFERVILSRSKKGPNVFHLWGYSRTTYETKEQYRNRYDPSYEGRRKNSRWSPAYFLSIHYRADKNRVDIYNFKYSGAKNSGRKKSSRFIKIKGRYYYPIGNKMPSHSYSVSVLKALASALAEAGMPNTDRLVTGKDPSLMRFFYPGLFNFPELADLNRTILLDLRKQFRYFRRHDANRKDLLNAFFPGVSGKVTAKVLVKALASTSFYAEGMISWLIFLSCKDSNLIRTYLTAILNGKEFFFPYLSKAIPSMDRTLYLAFKEVYPDRIYSWVFPNQNHKSFDFADSIRLVKAIFEDTLEPDYFDYKSLDSVVRRLKSLEIPTGSNLKEIHDYLVIYYRRIQIELAALRDAELAKPFKHAYPKIDGFETPYGVLRLPYDYAELVEWGDRMHNCIGAYASYVQSGESVVFGVFKDGEHTHCVSVNPRVFTIEQCSRKYNSHDSEASGWLVDNFTPFMEKSYPQSGGE